VSNNIWIAGVIALTDARRKQIEKSENASKTTATERKEKMSFEILGSTGEDWSCPQLMWESYLDLAEAFGWKPEGAFFKCDPQTGFGPYPSGSYTCNDWQIVTDDDARAMAAALNRAIAKINAGAPMTDEHVEVLKKFKIGDPFWKDPRLTEKQRAVFIALEAEYVGEHPDELRTIHTPNGTFDVNIRQIMDLADVASAGLFTIA
jgi:hypothetical protein